MPDYELGYASGSQLPLASALAVSAAFPGGFGPLTLNAKRFEWRKRPWNAPAGSEQVVDIGFDQLHLYDGGVYDNLGLEPFFDPGRQKPKQDGHYVIALDAGAPLPKGFKHGPLSVFRLKRVADIMSDQARALRVRAFASYLQRSSGKGAYVYIDTPVTDEAPCRSAAYAAQFPTTLRRLETSEFERIAAHGYAVALRVEREFGLYDELSAADASPPIGKHYV